MPDLNTDGPVVAAEATTETPTAEQVTTPASDSAGRSDKDVIVGYSVENKRLKAQLEKTNVEHAALVEKHKTDEQRRIDEKVNEQVAPHREEIKQLREAYFTEIDQMNAVLPEQYRRELNPDAPIAVLREQRKGIVDLSAALSIQTPPATAVDSGGVPPAEPAKRIVPPAEFLTWQQLVSTGKPGDLEKHKELREEMTAAKLEGRVR